MEEYSYAIETKDVTAHCKRLQVQPVFRPFAKVSAQSLDELHASPLLAPEVLMRHGVSHAAMLAAIAVTQCDVTSLTSLDVVLPWLQCRDDSVTAWMGGARALWQYKPVDTSRYEFVAAPLPDAGLFLPLPELIGGAWKASVVSVLTFSVKDIGTRLLAYHPPTDTVLPAVIIAFVSERRVRDLWGHCVLFDNGDVRWYPSPTLQISDYVILQRCDEPFCCRSGDGGDDADAAAAGEPSLLRMTIVNDEPVDVRHLASATCIGLRIGLYIAESIGGIRWGVITDASGPLVDDDSAVNRTDTFRVMFDDGTTQDFVSEETCKHEYLIVGRITLDGSTPIAVSPSHAALHRANSDADAVAGIRDRSLQRSAGGLFDSPRLLGTVVEVRWPLRCMVTRGIVVRSDEFETFAEVRFEDGSVKRYKREEPTGYLTVLVDQDGNPGVSRCSSQSFRFPEWWKPKAVTDGSETAAERGIKVDKTAGMEQLVRMLIAQEVEPVVALAAAVLCPLGVPTALAWIRGTRLASPDSKKERRDSEGSATSDAVVDPEQDIRMKLIDFGCTPSLVDRALGENVSRDPDLLLQWIFSFQDDHEQKEADEAAALAAGGGGVSETFDADVVPEAFREQYVTEAMDRGEMDIEGLLKAAVRIWHLKMFLLDLGFPDDVAAQVAGQTETRAAAEAMARGLAPDVLPPAREEHVSGASSISGMGGVFVDIPGLPLQFPMQPALRRDGSTGSASGGAGSSIINDLTPYAGNSGDLTPTARKHDDLNSSLGVLQRAVGIMRVLSSGHPLIARTLYDMCDSLPLDNVSFEGWSVVFGAKLLVEAATLYEVTSFVEACENRMQVMISVLVFAESTR